jgi:uncharacterized protein YjiS (DUF1127 family)
MHGSTTLISGRDGRQQQKAQSRLLATLLSFYRWTARKLRERRNLNAVMELSDAQLKDIGLSRYQTESDVHVYCRD